MSDLPVENSLPLRPVTRAWRAVKFTTSYLLFAVGCLALAIAAPLTALDRQGLNNRVRRMRLWAHRLAKSYLWLVTMMGLVRVDWPEKRVLPSGLIVANHPSLVDAVWILATQPNIALVLKGDLEKIGVLRYLAERLGYASNSDPERLLAATCEKLSRGEVVLVFPEATRTQPGQLPQFRLGAAEMALRAGVQVHPIVIHKAGAYLSKHVPWHAFPDDKLRWQISHAQSISGDPSLPHRQARRALTAELERFYHTQLQQPAVAHRTGDKEN